MKRFVLCVTLIGLFAGQASAGIMYELDKTTALKFTVGAIQIDVVGSLDRMTLPVLVTDNLLVYGASQLAGEVGYTAALHDDRTSGFPLFQPDLSDDGDVIARGRISAGNNAGLTGKYDGFEAWVANDNDDLWSIRLVVVDGSGANYSGWANLLSKQTAILSLPMGVDGLDFANVTDIGFEIMGAMNGAGSNPSNDDAFHFSAVPAPSAFLLCMLGLSAAGLRIRRKRA